MFFIVICRFAVTALESYFAFIVTFRGDYLIFYLHFLLSYFELFRITKERFVHLAVEIETTFTKESASIYYTPYQSGQRSATKGKLLHYYRYLKQELWVDNILLRSEAQTLRSSESANFHGVSDIGVLK